MHPTKCVTFVAGGGSNYLPVLLEDISGYLTDQATFDELRQCLIHLQEGRKYITQEIKQILLTLSSTIGTYHAIWGILTKREKEIMTFIAEGYSNQKIANILFRSTKTVASTKYNLVKKLDLRTSHELTTLALSMCTPK